MTVPAPLEPPTISPLAFPKHKGPGYVEIKPHDVNGIRDGLEQLYKNKKGFTQTWRKKKTRHPAVTVYLLTYTYEPSSAPGTSRLTAHLLEPTDKALDDNIPAPGQRRGPIPVGGRRKWLDDLGTWWLLAHRQPIEEQSFGQWVSHAGPSAAGLMLEDQLRREFVKKYQVPAGRQGKVKTASERGADIDFNELAEFFYELDAASGRAA
jgi:hypothetical protein